MVRAFNLLDQCRVKICCFRLASRIVDIEFGKQSIMKVGNLEAL
jgi:hypothetical protein